MRRRFYMISFFFIIFIGLSLSLIVTQHKNQLGIDHSYAASKLKKRRRHPSSEPIGFDMESDYKHSFTGEYRCDILRCSHEEYGIEESGYAIPPFGEVVETDITDDDVQDVFEDTAFGREVQDYEIANIARVALHFQYDQEEGYFGCPRKGSRARHISSDNPAETSRAFYEELSRGGKEMERTGNLTSRRQMQSGVIISYRESSSNGSPVVEYNPRPVESYDIKLNSWENPNKTALIKNPVGNKNLKLPKFQKIHFTYSTKTKK